MPRFRNVNRRLLKRHLAFIVAAQIADDVGENHGRLNASNDEVERRAGAPTPNEDALSKSSIRYLARRSCDAPRSLEPIVRGRAAQHPSDKWNRDYEVDLVGYEKYGVTAPNNRPDARRQ
jgi:hypothetical protein